MKTPRKPIASAKSIVRANYRAGTSANPQTWTKVITSYNKERGIARIGETTSIVTGSAKFGQKQLEAALPFLTSALKSACFVGIEIVEA